MNPIVSTHSFPEVSNEAFNEVTNSRNFTGKVVLVTGSNSGIGRGIAKLFSVLGAHVVLTGRRVEDVKKVAQEVQKLSPNKLKPLEVVADITVTEDLNRLLNETIETFGKLDVLVNNAGFLELTDSKDENFMQSFDSQLKTDLRGGLELSYLSAQYLEKNNGSIVNISSTFALKPMRTALAYGAAHAGVDYATKVLALELGPKIRVNSINVGFVLHEGWKGYTEFLNEIYDKAINSSILKRWGNVLDIAKGVAFLASTDAEFITGTNLIIDGGSRFNFQL